MKVESALYESSVSSLRRMQNRIFKSLRSVGVAVTVEGSGADNSRAELVVTALEPSVSPDRTHIERPCICSCSARSLVPL